MEIENIVANTVLIKAKEGGCSKNKGRSKKWRTYLKFPHVSECLYLQNEIECTYEYVVDHQPIGKEQFKLFCVLNDDYTRAMSFLEAVEEFETAEAEERRNLAEMIVPRFFDSLKRILIEVDPSQASTSHETKPEIFEHCQANMNKFNEANKLYSKDLFNEITRETRHYLSSAAFSKFIKTPYFHRYLQWKWLEKRPVDKHVFRMYRVLGKGGFGEVCACQVRASGKMYALKKLEKKRVKKRHAETLSLNEKQILERLNSRFIVSLAYAFETKDALNLVLTLMNGGDLKYHLYNMESGNGGFPEERVRFYAAQITLGLQHLHEKRIVYRDLKPENILLDDTGNIRISDLGLAVELIDNHPVRGRVGTVGYMPPEVIRNDKYQYSVDWWGLGCLIYEMIEAKAPFRARREKVKREEVERRVLNEIERYSPKFSESARTLCRGLLQKEHTLRMGSRRTGRRPENGAVEIREHPFFATVNWRRLEAGKVSPPFEPDARTVYAKDVLDIEQFSTVKGVRLDEEDHKLYEKFNTGRVSIPWQHEMIETECYQDLNAESPIGPNGKLPDDLNMALAAAFEKERRRREGPNWFKRLFMKNNTTTKESKGTSEVKDGVGKATPRSAHDLKTAGASEKSPALNGSNGNIKA